MRQPNADTAGRQENVAKERLGSGQHGKGSALEIQRRRVSGEGVITMQMREEPSQGRTGESPGIADVTGTSTRVVSV